MSYKANRLLNITEPTTRYIPALAIEIGHNESILLMQFEFWIAISDNVRDNRRWTFQSTRDIQKQLFPTLSLMTINRLIHSLEDLGWIIVSSQYNRFKYDRTRWFSINLEAVEKLKSISVRETAPLPPTSTLPVETSPQPVKILTPALETPPQKIETPPQRVEASPQKIETTIPESSPEKIKTNKERIPVSALTPLLTPTPSPAPEIKSSSVFSEYLERLMVLVPVENQTNRVQARLEKGLEEGMSFQYLAETINYVSDHKPKKYLSYLGLAMDKQYCQKGYVPQAVRKAKEKADAKALEAKIQQEMEALKLTQAEEKIEHERKVSLVASVEDREELDSFILNSKTVNDFIKNRYRRGKGQLMAQLILIDAFFASLINNDLGSGFVYCGY